MWALIGHELETPLPRMTYAEAMARFGTDKPDLRMGQELVDCTAYFADTPFRVFQAPYVGAVVMPGGAAPAAQAARRLAGVGQAARRQGPGLRPGQGGRRDHRPGRQEPLRRRARRHRRPRRRAAGRLRLLRRRPGQGQPRPARRGAPRDRPALRPDRRGRLALPLGRRRAALRAGRRGHRLRRRRGGLQRLDRRPPRLHLAAGRRDLRPATPAAPWPGPTTSSATATRSAAGRSVSTAATSRSASSRSWASSEAEAQEKFGFLLDAFAVRRTAARRHRLRLGPDRRPARPHRLDPRRDRLPEVRRRLRPAHGGSCADHARAAQGSRCRRGRRRRTSRKPLDTSVIFARGRDQIVTHE